MSEAATIQDDKAPDRPRRTPPASPPDGQPTGSRACRKADPAGPAKTTVAQPEKAARRRPEKEDADVQEKKVAKEVQDDSRSSRAWSSRMRWTTVFPPSNHRP